MIVPRRTRRVSRKLALRIAGGVAAAFLLGALGLNAVNDAYGANEGANARLRAGDKRGALAAYRALQQDHPELGQLSVNSGAALYDLQEYARAVADLTSAATSPATQVRAVAFYDKGNALFRQDKVAEARDAYIAALRADPSDRDAKFNLEVIERIQALQRQRSQPSSSQPPGPGQGQQPPQQQGQQGRQPGGQQPQPGQGQGDPNAPLGNVNDGTQTTGQSLSQALSEFRRDLTPEEALRLLDALRRETPGLEGIIEGRPLPVPPNQEPLY